MKKLLSLPPNLVDCFHEIENVSKDEWFCTSDPVGSKLGSGGGTTWLLDECFKEWGGGDDFDSWLAKDKRLLLHAGGQSRRLPAYAPSGKILTPIPVFRWAKGQRLGQNLLSLQLPLYKKMMDIAPDCYHTLIASGDVYVRTAKSLQPIPEADVVCYGMWVDPSLAKNHGVFVSRRQTPDVLECMLQKPSVEKLAEIMQTHLFLMDIGVWLLSDKAVKLLMNRSRTADGLKNYDLYSEFGCALGSNPTIDDAELKELKVAILPLDGGEFYHYGTSREIISSTLRIQNLVNDQREIMHLGVKPNPAIFIQNSEMKQKLAPENENVWIENSCISEGWKLGSNQLITGVPENNWNLTVPSGVCVDVVPLNDDEYVLRPYGFNDAFRGSLNDESTMFMGRPFAEWATVHNVCDITVTDEKDDLQAAQIFPVFKNVECMGKVLAWMISDNEDAEAEAFYKDAQKMCADEISAQANLVRLQKQREQFRAGNWNSLSRNYANSVFYQVNLADAAKEFVDNGLEMPAAIPAATPLMTRIHDHIFRSQYLRLKGEDYKAEDDKAFELLREGLTETVLANKQQPRLNVQSDQIVWSRCPVRIDIAGGWTDTAPYCLMEGGNVVNIAIDLNGQQPLQAYIKPCREFKIVLRSIDLGAMEEITTYRELQEFYKVGSPFSIPKAALVLAGFYPNYSLENFESLEQQLRSFGCGIELTTFSAIPAGSGLGTSSILASTVLGAISDFCGLAWDKNEVGQRTLVLEQLLTTGGGWQDQFGGVLHGAKLLQTNAGFDQCPSVKWLPQQLYTKPEYAACHLLYYTGITRTAKQILAEIVRGMFLNSTEHLELLAEMKEHALDLYDAILREDFDRMGRLIAKTWKQNQRLDSGTNPPEVQKICEMVKDYCLGYKLPGAGGGGFLYMVAKSPEAALKIRNILTSNPPNERARFVDMKLSDSGLQVSRS